MDNTEPTCRIDLVHQMQCVLEALRSNDAEIRLASMNAPAILQQAISALSADAIDA